MEENKLDKSITFVEAIAIVVGMIIGSGIFLKPSIIFYDAGSPIMGVLAWIVYNIGLCFNYCRIGSSHP